MNHREDEYGGSLENRLRIAKEIVEATTIVPALLKNETHPYHQSTVMKEHIAQYGTVMESWFPLGGRGNTQVLFDDETTSSTLQRHMERRPHR